MDAQMPPHEERRRRRRRREAQGRDGALEAERSAVESRDETCQARVISRVNAGVRSIEDLVRNFTSDQHHDALLCSACNLKHLR